MAIKTVVVRPEGFFDILERGGTWRSQTLRNQGAELVVSIAGSYKREIFAVGVGNVRVRLTSIEFRNQNQVVPKSWRVVDGHPVNLDIREIIKWKNQVGPSIFLMVGLEFSKERILEESFT